MLPADQETSLTQEALPLALCQGSGSCAAWATEEGRDHRNVRKSLWAVTWAALDTGWLGRYSDSFPQEGYYNTECTDWERQNTWSLIIKKVMTVDGSRIRETRIKIMAPTLTVSIWAVTLISYVLFVFQSGMDGKIYFTR